MASTTPSPTHDFTNPINDNNNINPNSPVSPGKSRETVETVATGACSTRPKKRLKYSNMVAKVNFCVARAIALNKEDWVDAFLDILIAIMDTNFDPVQLGNDLVRAMNQRPAAAAAATREKEKQGNGSGTRGPP
eukprot:CAMPEP_0168780514 /NCGR_PEP_ID=MMETSP0725-20121227/8157_1 /TAXON_ID=265536 /ORGANISM="Amphiprora sp., Strain CCMP467" /LENGTH=133 /DNA_ID=CAMNT_0008830357 /DNA_START=43 /DNA_END=444 /DNA_ORIENTATION=-